MRKDEYLSSQAVKDFIAWLETILDAPRSFIHKYHHEKNDKDYEFDNLFTAYKKYEWESFYNFDELSISLKNSIDESDERSCAETCNMILKWGGVLNKGNKKRVSELGSVCSYLLAVRDRLGMDLSSGEYFFPGFQMTSGFSKIYSALLDDYIIYDSRVSAALGLLVRAFCVHNEEPVVPLELMFAWKNGLGKQIRNPSFGAYVFPGCNTEKQYLENNIRANWLMSEAARTTKSKFADEPLKLKALEKALFMIGYDLSGFIY